MGDGFTETETTGWFTRIKEAFVGVLIGFVLVVAAPVLLFWNEGRSVKTAAALGEARQVVVEGKPDAIDPALEGKLVHLAGKATTAETLVDPEFGVRVNAIRLEREVAMYQWKEEKETRKRKNLGGSETKETTYEYEQVWSERLIDSGSFKRREGHENPGKMPFESQGWQASDVRLGAYRLSPAQVGAFGGFRPVGKEQLPPPASGRQSIDGGYYLGKSPSAPEIGDVRVLFREAPPGDVSVIAQQTGETFRPMVMGSGYDVSLLEMGVVPAGTMIRNAERANAMMTWILRAVGFVLMGLGFGLVFRPLSVVADVVPIIGSIVGMGTGCAAFGLAAVGSLITIAVGWVAYRPLIGVPLLVLGLGGLIGLFVLASKRKAARAG